MAAARLPAAIGAGEQPRFPSKGDAAQPSLGGVVGEANAPIFKEQGKGRPAFEDVVDRLDEVVSAREPKRVERS